MKYSSSVTVPADASAVLPVVSDLSTYPGWMPLVFSALALSDEAWEVELRAKVGIFARSKRLRMVRSHHDAGRIVFERREADGRRHAPWVLVVTLEGQGPSTTVTMDLSYGGTLWTGGVLDRVLASHVDQGKAGLVRMFQSA